MAYLSERSRRTKEQGIQLIKVLQSHGFDGRFAGGCVRDLLLGLNPSDFDIATTSTPEQNADIFKNEGFKVVPTGIDHGTVTVVAKNSVFELTTLRRDVETDGRRATIAYSTSFEEDASRRDFTINAMYEDINGQIFDFFDGQKHLQNKILEFVGDPEQRIIEDYLRIMRFFRFKAQLSFDHQPHTLEAISNHKEGLRKISQERITQELKKLFLQSQITSTLEAMNATGIWNTIFCGNQNFLSVQPSLLKTLDQLREVSKELRTFSRFFATLTTIGKNQLETIATQFRLANSELIQLQLLSQVDSPDIHNLDQQFKIMDFIDRFSRDKTCDIYVYLQAFNILVPSHYIVWNNIQRCEEQKGYLRKSKMPISGLEICAHLNINQGAIVGEILRFLLEQYRQERWSTKEHGLELAQKFYSH